MAAAPLPPPLPRPVRRPDPRRARRHRRRHRGATGHPPGGRRADRPPRPRRPVRPRRAGPAARGRRGHAHLHPPLVTVEPGARHGGHHPAGHLRTPAAAAGRVPRPLAERPTPGPGHRRPLGDPPLPLLRPALPGRQPRHVRRGGRVVDPAALAARSAGRRQLPAVGRGQPPVHPHLSAHVAADAGRAGRPGDPGRGDGPRPAHGEVVRPPVVHERPVRQRRRSAPRDRGRQGPPARRHVGPVRPGAQPDPGGGAGGRRDRGRRRPAHDRRAGRLRHAAADADLADRVAGLDHRQRTGGDDGLGPDLRGARRTTLHRGPRECAAGRARRRRGVLRQRLVQLSRQRTCRCCGASR